MRYWMSLMTASAVLCSIRFLPADEPQVKLPPEGAWGRYHVVIKQDSGSEIIGKSTLKLLKTAEDQGRPCRWLEIDSDLNAGSKEAFKFLIPEQALLESERPLDETVKAFYRNEQGQISDWPLDLAGVHGTWLLFLPGIRKSAKSVDELQTVEYQSGKLVIPAGHRGEYRWNYAFKSEPKKLTMVWNYTVWVDSKVSAGFARARMQASRLVDANVIHTWTEDISLEDFGLDAKSVFSD